jgi:hypothetical protein
VLAWCDGIDPPDGKTGAWVCAKCKVDLEEEPEPEEVAREANAGDGGEYDE